jgi:hypothetical protein
LWDRVLLIGLPQTLAVAAYNHLGALHLDLEGLTYNFSAANVTVQTENFSPPDAGLET